MIIISVINGEIGMLTKKEFQEKFMFFAFSEKQLQNEIEKRNLKIKEVFSLGDGIYLTNEGNEYLKNNPWNSLM
jgi:hypothetical protein